MDGNGRWARARGLPRVEGHRAGAKSVRALVEECRRLGVRYLTLYAFSSENWQRPAEEVSSLMGLFAHFLESELGLMCENNIRLRAIGNLARLPEKVRAILQRTEESTRQHDALDLILAVSYGGREELLHAAQQLACALADGQVKQPLSEQAFRDFLYAPDVPDPDLLIRTSDEHRISNFLLWQLAYTEIVFSSALWPDFRAKEFHECLQCYAKRERRFGLTVSA
jgi:undecaprenyl diphosphate synthase